MQNIRSLQNIRALGRRGGGAPFNPSQIQVGGQKTLLQQVLDKQYPTIDGMIYDERKNKGTARAIQLGRCYEFDGTNDFVTIPTLTFTGDFSIKFNVNLSTLVASGMILSGGTGATGFEIYYSTGKSILLFYAGVSILTSSIIDLSINDFFMIEVVRVSGVITIKLNGVSKGTVSNSSTCILNTLGCRSGGTIPLKGKVYGVSIYNGSSLSLMYKCDEQGGSSALDSSGNGNHGVITNATPATFHATQNVYSYQNEVGYCDAKNYWKYTQEFDQTNWTKNGGSILSTAETDPMGGATADIFTEDSSTGNHRIFQATLWTTGQTYTMSISLKYIARQFVGLNFTDPAGSSTILCDLVNGTIVGTSGSIVASGVENQGNGWYRFWVTRVSTGTGGSSTIIYGSSTGTSVGNTSYTGLNGQAFYVWGAQIALGSNQSYQRNLLLEAGNKIPRNESNTSVNAFGYTLQYPGQVPYNAYLEQSNCPTFDGVNDYVECPAGLAVGLIGNTIKVVSYISYTLDGRTYFSKGGNVSTPQGGYVLNITGGKVFIQLYQAGSTSVYRTYTGSSTLATNTVYKIEVEFTTSTCLITINGVADTVTISGATGTYGDASVIPSLATRGAGAQSQFSGKIFGFNIYKNGNLEVSYPMAEGYRVIAYDVSPNGYHGTYTNSPTWSKQDVYHYNVVRGFSLYEHASTADILVPYSSAGSPLSITPQSGYTKTTDNPAGPYHNGAETLIDFTGNVLSPVSVIGSWMTNWSFNSARTNPKFKRTSTLAGVDYRADRFLSYRDALTGTNLSKVNKYVTTKII